MINEKTDEIHNTCPFHHFEIYCEICHYEIIPKKAVLKQFRAHCRLVAHPPFHHLAYTVRPAVKAKRSGAGIGSLANSVARAPDDLTTARSRLCWCVCTRVKKVTCCYGKSRRMRATADGRANQHARWLGKLKSAKSYAARLARRQNPAPCTAPHRKAHLSLHTHITHYVHYLQPSTPPRTRRCSIPVLHASLPLQASTA